MHLLIDFARFLGRLLCGLRLNVIGRVAERFSRELFLSINNQNFDHITNGEKWVLDRLKSTPLKCLFDVGANEGEWTQMVQERFTDSHIYCFECIPQTFNTLAQNLKDVSSVTLINKGLSDVNEELEFFISSKTSLLASSVKVIEDEQTTKIKAAVIVGDDYCLQQNISNIDFLKIDVEGMENKVLGGFKNLLSTKQISIIQFEYGMVNIESKFLLQDFYNLLLPYGYVLGKIYPNHVDFKEYDHHDEKFIGGNFLAIRQERNDLISLFKKSS